MCDIVKSYFILHLMSQKAVVEFRGVLHLISSLLS